MKKNAKKPVKAEKDVQKSKKISTRELKKLVGGASWEDSAGRVVSR